MKNNFKIGLALGGGGARGLAHIGVLKVLEEAGIKIDYIAGVSMGALVGAGYSLGMKVDELEREASSFTKTKAMKELVDISTFRYSVLKGKKIFKYINNFLGQAEFSDTKIPFKIIATNLSDGNVVRLIKGNLAKAVEASICVPGILPPVKIGNDFLVDGGVANPTPVDEALSMGADIVIGVDLIIKKPVKIIDNPNLIFTLMQSYEIIRNKVFDACINSEHDNRVILIKPDLNGHGLVNSFKFYNIKEFIEAGEIATRHMLPEIKRKIEAKME